MDYSKKLIDTQQVISLCYGYGGIEKGVSKIIPIKPVAYVEIEAFQIFNLVAAMEAGVVDPAPVWTDIKTFDAKPFHNRVHGIIGGYPCQGESLAGTRLLWNDPRFIYPYIERIISTVRPFWCFFENVSGHLSGSFPYVLDSLHKMGYKVEAGLFTAEEVGAPHQRKRLFILAVDDSTDSRLWKTKISKVKNWKSGYGKNWELEVRFKRSSNEYISNSNSSRLEGLWDKQNRKRSTRLCYRERKNQTSIDEWVARPQEKQYEWEAPRTIEPGMGCTINGYNFRTELLRQYGNGVVSQTAALAFETLLLKSITKNKQK